MEQRLTQQFREVETSSSRQIGSDYAEPRHVSGFGWMRCGLPMCRDELGYDRRRAEDSYDRIAAACRDPERWD